MAVLLFQLFESALTLQTAAIGPVDRELPVEQNNGDSDTDTIAQVLQFSDSLRLAFTTDNHLAACYRTSTGSPQPWHPQALDDFEQVVSVGGSRE